MPKRKRESEEAAPSTVRDTRQQRRILHAFNQGAHQLAQAFKLAKGFERQKLGRRKKDANKEEDYRAARRIDAEIEAVKGLDANAGAKQYLAKSLLKIKAAALHPDLPNDIRNAAAPAVTEPPGDEVAKLNVTARICNSNPVKKAFPAALKEVKSELGIKDSKQDAQKKKRLRAKDYEGAQSEDDLAPEVERQVKLSRIGESPAADAASTDSDPNQRVSGYDSENDDDDAMELYDGRLASSGDDDDLGEVSDIGDLERQLEMEGISRTSKSRLKSHYETATDLAASEDESEDNVTAQEPRKPLITKKSSFVPSLTLGGYISGSGSEIDDEIDIAPPRKNRRGQRARQQIWEQKYGGKAKHLQRQERSKGWDPKRGASNGTTRTGHGGRDGSFGAVKTPGKNANDVPVAIKKPRRDDTGPLHPSWEAAKKAKEKKSAPVTFQGKKISFD